MSSPALPPVVEDGHHREFDKNYILFWNNVALDLNRLTHTIVGPQDGPPVSARALGILHLAIHDAYFGIFSYASHIGARGLLNVTPYLAANVKAGITDTRMEAKNAVAGAAITVLSKLYKNPAKPNLNTPTSTMLALGAFIDSAVRSYTNTNELDFRSPGYVFGVQAANAILGKLEIKSTEKGADAGSYMPYTGHPYFFDDDPSHPVRPRPIDPNNPALGSKATRPYHGPFYGKSAAVFATPTDWKLADPYVVPGAPMPAPEDENFIKYLESVEDVHRMGGAEGLPTTKRSPAQTASALFWAYDGANLIGTPPRLYNQIIRQIAYDRAVGPLDSDTNNAEFARLFALANVAMADAGIFCWREKYRYELWRPLSGVRQHPSAQAPGGSARPFWRVLGAPATNTNEGGFKPPFPAYPSGHATFGAAAFQIVRRFYNAIDSKVLAPLPSPSQSSDSVQQNPIQSEASPAYEPEQYAEFHGSDTIGFDFVSDELNGVNRELYQLYDPSHAITDQAGDVRTRLVLSFGSMKEAIFSNAISRIWLGVHWHFDAFAGEDIMEKLKGGDAKASGSSGKAADGEDIMEKVEGGDGKASSSGSKATDGEDIMEKVEGGDGKASGSGSKATDGEDTNPQRPEGYKQLYACKPDGSTKYRDVSDMDWFRTRGARAGDPKQWWYGGVPLGMLIADDIFSTGMKFVGSLKDLSAETPMVRTAADE